MMAGLSVLLEAQKELPGTPLQVVSKTTLLRPLLLVPPTHKPPPTSTFLEACFLCGKHLSGEKDIYMYRGDRAFCSVECRCRQIFMDEEESVRTENCSLAASPTRGRRKRVGKHSRQAAAAADTGGFAY